MPQQEPLVQTPAPPAGARLLLASPRTATAVLALSMVAWAFLAWMVVDMSHPLAQLIMPASSDWSAATTVAVVALWAVMMAAMMLPAALPMILAFADLSRRGGDSHRGAAFAGAYLAIWTVFSLAAAAAQWGLQAMGWVNPMVVSHSAFLSAALLLIAGIYQFSPLKRACLARCRTPMGFLIGEWRAGLRGAAVMGLRHGLLCLGCCWALMLLLFVGGAMNLAWIAALSLAIAIEKLAPGGQRIAMMLGAGLIVAAAARLLMM
ncbi:MAG TPA: DUF2182 domain-containing protein [Ramlibacter sp.]|nr:DUF2182 domain-containing protein [Ramlibacter sp.]